MIYNTLLQQVIIFDPFLTIFSRSVFYKMFPILIFFLVVLETLILRKWLEMDLPSFVFYKQITLHLLGWEEPLLIGPDTIFIRMKSVIEKFGWILHLLG